MSERADDHSISPCDVDRAAERLLATIDAACDPSTDFATQLEAALRAAFNLFAAEPSVIGPLTEGSVSPESLARQRSCRASCATRLRAAAQRSIGPQEHPPHLETFLLAAIQFEVSRAPYEGEAERLLTSIAELRRFILAFYPDA